MVPPRITYSGNQEAAATLIGAAQSALRNLHAYMQKTQLTMLGSRIQFPDGVSIVVSNIRGMDFINIYVPPGLSTQKLEELIIPEVKVYGFLFRPHMIADYPSYVLTDDDGGTGRIYKDKETWKVKLNTQFENYGIVDWKGKNTSAAGKPSNAKVLTWRGPSTRYFPHDPTLYVSGYSSVEETLESGVVFTVFGRHVYTQGAVIATVPSVGTYGLVLGAGINKNTIVIVAVIRGAGYSFKHSVFIQPLGSKSTELYDVDLHPKGWKKLFEAELDRGKVPWFFNSVATAAVTVVNGLVHRLTINYETEVVSHSSSPTTTTTRTVDGSQIVAGAGDEYGTPPGNSTYTMGYPAGCVASESIDLFLNGIVGKGRLGDDTYNYRADYAGEEIIAIDYNSADAEVVVKLRQEGFEETVKTMVGHTGVMQKTIFMTESDYANYDPETLNSTIVLEVNQESCMAVIVIQSTGLCLPVYTASAGILTPETPEHAAYVTVSVPGCDPCGARSGSVQSVTVTGNDCGGLTASTTIVLTFPAIVISPLVASVGDILSGGTVIGYSVVGGVPPYTWSVDKGSASGGSWNVAGQCGVGTITVTDSCGQSVSQQRKMPGGSFKNPVTYSYDYHSQNASWGYYCDCYSSPGFGLPDFTSPDGMTLYTSITGSCNRSDSADWRCNGLSNQLVIPNYPMTFCDGGGCPVHRTELITGYTKRTWSC